MESVMNAHVRSLETAPPDRKSRWRRFSERQLPILVIYLLVFTIAAAVMYPHVVVTVRSGQVGLLWKRFAGGTVLNPQELNDEGIHFIWPWNEMFMYDLRVQSINETYNAISSDGVSLTAVLNIRFRLKRDSIPALHQVIGPDYAKLLGPGIASQMREVIAQYTAEQVYSTARQEIQEKIRDRVIERLGDKMMEGEGQASYSVAMRDTIILYDTLLFGIELPLAIATAINRKTEQYYISEEYKFRIEREKRESERKTIEAEGIRSFQQIVSQGISDSYLRWRGIEATVQLSQSNNAKIVIVGGGKDGLPIILGNADAPSTPPRAEAPPSTNQAKNPAASSPVTATEQPDGGVNKSADKASSALPAATAKPPAHPIWQPSVPEIQGFLSWLVRRSENVPESTPAPPGGAAPAGQPPPLSR
jgi:regulator of protease activity HflC (stomatin/prohibitin superfamily)